jgi:succinate dehydrogenase/fumarate reductase flavoprotein subunit
VLEAFVKKARLDMLRLEHRGCPWNREKDDTLAKDPLGQGSPSAVVCPTPAPRSGPAA